MSDMAPFDELLTILKGVDLRASLEAAELSLPGVWITLDQVSIRNLAGQLQLSCLLFLVSGDRDPYRAMAELLPLYRDKLLEAITPDGPVVAQGLVLPSDPTPMPALRVPLNLYTT